MREIVEVGAEVGLEHVAPNFDDIAVEEVHKVFTADVENVVASLVVLVHLHAASTEEFWDVIIAEESRGNFEATTTTESPINVIGANDGVTNDVMVTAEHLRRQLIHRVDLARADLCVINFYAMAKEQLVELLNLSACTKQALVAPEVLKIIATDPLASFLVQVSKRGFEAMPVRKVAF